VNWWRAPVLVLATGLAALAAATVGFQVLGFSVSGFAWVLPLVLAVLMLLRHPGRVLFPWWIWVAWTLVLVLYLAQARAPHALQRTIMMVSPVVVGMAASAARVPSTSVLATLRFLRALAIGLFVAIAWNTGFLFTGVLPEYGGFAASVMTATLLATVFATEYSFGRRSSLGWWGVMQLIPLIAFTRTGMFASALTFPLCFGPIKLRKRILSLALIGAGGLLIFFTPRMQTRMFYSGSGTFSEMSLDNPDFATGGRSTMWPEFVQEIEKKPWFGHGANASEAFAGVVNPGVEHPHNDWLRLMYDYGYLGAVLFALTLLVQFLHAFLAARGAQGLTKVLFVCVVSSFVVLSVFMLTDNIVLYAAFFGNLQFALLGLAYATAGRRKESQTPISSPRKPRGSRGSAQSDHYWNRLDRFRWRFSGDINDLKGGDTS
jgi:O-antigen ligase